MRLLSVARVLQPPSPTRAWPMSPSTLHIVVRGGALGEGSAISEPSRALPTWTPPIRRYITDTTALDTLNSSWLMSSSGR